MEVMRLKVQMLICGNNILSKDALAKVLATSESNLKKTLQKD